MTIAGNAIRLVWSAAFLGGAFNHARQILAGGGMPYSFAPAALNLFWTLLLPIDLLVVALLWWKVRAGAVLGLVVMVADVAINSGFVQAAASADFPTALFLQTLFLGFVLGSIAILLGGQAKFVG